MKSSVKAWLEFAANDLLAAERLQNDEALANISCFHSQQCVEKALKAVLENLNIIPPKTHDLIRLYGMIQVQLDIEEDMLAQLNETYLDSRYPLTMGHLPKGFPSLEEAAAFCDFAMAAYNNIKLLLSKQAN